MVKRLQSDHRMVILITNSSMQTIHYKRLEANYMFVDQHFYDEVLFLFFRDGLLAINRESVFFFIG